MRRRYLFGAVFLCAEALTKKITCGAARLGIYFFIMIVGIKGIVASAGPLRAVINVNGIFYEVNIPITTAERLAPIGSETFLYTVAIYREDSQALYGFATSSDRDFFRLLIEKVSGIGPKIALNIMSRMRNIHFFILLWKFL